MRRALPLLFALTFACESVDETPISTRSEYVVLDVEPIDGVVSTGERRGPVRVALVELVFDRGRATSLAYEALEPSCPGMVRCETLARQRGAELVRGYGSAGLAPGALRDWSIDETRTIEGRHLTFGNITSTSAMTLGGSPARAKVTLRKRCLATIRHVERQARGSDSRGIITLPKSVPQRWIELVRPPCFDPADLELEQLTGEERRARAERAAEIAASDRARQAAYDERSRREFAERQQRELGYRDRRFADLVARGTAAARAVPDTALAARTPLEQRAHRELAPLMHGGSIAELTIERRCLSRRGRRKQGSCAQSAPLLRVEWSAGYAWVNAKRNRAREEALARAWIDEAGALRLELGDDAGALGEAEAYRRIAETITFAARDLSRPGEEAPPGTRLPVSGDWSYVAPVD